jgi:hypothetical protein
MQLIHQLVHQLQQLVEEVDHEEYDILQDVHEMV